MSLRARLRRFLLMDEHVCPWWLAYGFDNPVRRWLHPPERLLAPWVRTGMTAIDVGCGMGHFTVGMARMVGPAGRVVAVDLQERMLAVVGERAARQGLSERIERRLCRADRLGLDLEADFLLTFWMAHEVPDRARFFGELHAALRPGGSYLLAEPTVHVSARRFREIAGEAEAAGFAPRAAPAIPVSRAVLFARG